MTHTVIETMNKIELLQREDGKYGIHDVLSGEITFRYQTADLARKIAQSMSLENDRIDAYEVSHSA